MRYECYFTRQFLGSSRLQALLSCNVTFACGRKAFWLLSTETGCPGKYQLVMLVPFSLHLVQKLMKIWFHLPSSNGKISLSLTNVFQSKSGLCMNTWLILWTYVWKNTVHRLIKGYASYVHYYTLDLLWKIWLVDNIQSIYIIYIRITLSTLIGGEHTVNIQ